MWEASRVNSEGESDALPEIYHPQQEMSYGAVYGNTEGGIQYAESSIVVLHQAG